METLKKVVTNQYFPAGAVLTGVLLFWAVGMLGGLSLLNNNQPPLTTLTWLLFVYAAAVLTPIAGLLAAADLLRRWRRNRAAALSPATSAVEAAGTIQESVSVQESVAVQEAGTVQGASAEPAAAPVGDAAPSASDPHASGQGAPSAGASQPASPPSAPTKAPRPGRKKAA